MKHLSETVIFFGSGPVGASCLKLLASNFEIEAIITKPRAPHHKGDVPVISTAQQLNIPYSTVTNKQTLNNLMSTTNFNSRLAVLIDFGIIVSKEVIDKFELGIVNSHFSLLPRWRGADPITFSILNGDDKTGVSLMVIDEGMDTGKLIAQKSLKLSSAITTPDLTQKLIKLSDHLISEYLPKYISGSIKLRSQPHSDRATYSRKLNKSDGKIDWSKSAQQLQQEVRAFLGWPGSYTNLFGKEVILTDVSVNDYASSGNIGEINVNRSIGLLEVQCQFGTLKINKIKPIGKREMSAKDFLVGYFK